MMENLSTMLYGVNTKTFGETTSLPEGLMEEHYYTYLNRENIQILLKAAANAG